jgi:hypothetical protein
MNLGDMGYRLAVVQPDGDRVFIEDFLTSLAWEDYDGQIAARLTAAAINDKAGRKRLAQHLPNGAEVRLYAGTRKPMDERFRGRVFANTTRWAGGERTHDILAYDPLYYLQQSTDDRYYPAGQTGVQIIKDIARAWSIPTGTIKGPDVKLGRKAFRDRTLAEQIEAVLRDARERGAGRWIARMEAGKLETVKVGAQQRAWSFDRDTIHSLEVSRSIEALLTRVEVVGRDKQGSKLLATATTPLLKDFGRLQQTISRADVNTAKGAERAAKALLRESGAEEKRRSLLLPDVPEVRRGDQIHVRAGTLSGFFVVRSVLHDAAAQQMAVDLAGPPREDDVDIDFEDIALDDWIPPDERIDGSVMTGDAAKALAIASNVLRGPAWVYDKALPAARRAGGGFTVISWRRTTDSVAGPGISWHYNGGRALDIIANPLSRLDRLYAELQKEEPTEMLWRVEDHYDHLHVAWEAA